MYAGTHYSTPIHSHLPASVFSDTNLEANTLIIDIPVPVCLKHTNEEVNVPQIYFTKTVCKKKE